MEDLIASSCELVAAVIEAAGAAAYGPVLAAHHLPGLLSWLRPRQPEGVRGVAMGALADIAERMQVGGAEGLW